MAKGRKAVGRSVMLDRCVRYLDKELDIDCVEDSSVNGLQVGPGAKTAAKLPVRRVAFAVDASLESFREAARRECELLVVHHGLLWSTQAPITGVMYDRVAFLVRKKMALYAAHLPLDMHPRFGHNIEICRTLGLKEIKDFGEYHGVDIGFRGELGRKLSLKAFVKLCEKKFEGPCTVMPFGSKTVKSVAVVSGGGSSALDEALETSVDVLVTGEPQHWNYHEARDGGINVVFAGHYHTETLGLKALAKRMKKKLQVKTEFLDLPPAG